MCIIILICKYLSMGGILGLMPCDILQPPIFPFLVPYEIFFLIEGIKVRLWKSTFFIWGAHREISWSLYFLLLVDAGYYYYKSRIFVVVSSELFYLLLLFSVSWGMATQFSLCSRGSYRTQASLIGYHFDWVYLPAFGCLASTQSSSLRFFRWAVINLWRNTKSKIRNWGNSKWRRKIRWGNKKMEWYSSRKLW